jgi:outer membrane autotransporter protein
MFLPAYRENAVSGSSQFALSYANRTFAATRTEIGARFDSDALMANGIKLYSRLAWAHDFDNEGISSAFFQSLPGSSFLINSSKPARDGALTTVGFEYRLADGWSVLGKFDGEFSSTTAIFGGTGTIRKVWREKRSRSSGRSF